MRPIKITILLALLTVVFNCGNNPETYQEEFSINLNVTEKVIPNNQTVQLSLNNPKNRTISSTSYSINGKDISESLDLSTVKLGKQTIEAVVKFDETSVSITKDITIVSSEIPKIYTFKVLNEYPHDPSSYTQGLEFHNGTLYEGTGQRGASKLRKVNYQTGDILQDVDIAKEYFGEGISILNNTIYQLTWQRGVGFTYDLETLERKGNFKYGKSKEGWGLCNDGSVLYKSDGTENIWILDPETLVEKDRIQAYTHKGRIIELNELEWVNGRIYSNRWQKNGVLIINPTNGAVEGIIDFSPLREQVTQHPKLDVLNGLAFNPETNTLFVTGKYWDKLFEVEIIEK